MKPLNDPEDVPAYAEQHKKHRKEHSIGSNLPAAVDPGADQSADNHESNELNAYRANDAGDEPGVLLGRIRTPLLGVVRFEAVLVMIHRLPCERLPAVEEISVNKS